MQEIPEPQEQGPLPRSREAVDWWLKKWGRQAVINDKEPLTREDVERLIEVNGGKAEGLELSWRDMRGINLGARLDSHKGEFQSFNLQGIKLFRADLQDADLFKANLQNAALGYVNLKGAALFEANLQKTRLWFANLQSAGLAMANLQGANLHGTELQGADFRWAKLQAANLSAVQVSSDTNFEGVEWDKGYISVLERQEDYEAAISLYRQLKEWYDRAGMRAIAGEFHYREREAARKAQWQSLSKEVKELKQGMMTAWRRLTGKEKSVS
jgi:hypothetical protein